ncbi:uncharacterized protein LOC126418738 [Schistocerca serialis cubense]|uniref:uncharacterized protein LOC126418738 n=1 Tax=Schistocerca serialis cubense TaxID=2023355 RepID=UPI00214E15C0|nr:uncharacterized protein LOC126418738 [Schistocerca serialis cubense]
MDRTAASPSPDVSMAEAPQGKDQECRSFYTEDPQTVREYEDILCGLPDRRVEAQDDALLAPITAEDLTADSARGAPTRARARQQRRPPAPAPRAARATPGGGAQARGRQRQRRGAARRSAPASRSTTCGCAPPCCASDAPAMKEHRVRALRVTTTSSIKGSSGVDVEACGSLQLLQLELELRCTRAGGCSRVPHHTLHHGTSTADDDQDQDAVLRECAAAITIEDFFRKPDHDDLSAIKAQKGVSLLGRAGIQDAYDRLYDALVAGESCAGQLALQLAAVVGAGGVGGGGAAPAAAGRRVPAGGRRGARRRRRRVPAPL